MYADILSELRSDDEVNCEVHFCHKVDSNGTYTIWNGVINLLYKKNGKWRVIDYKTNVEAEGLDYKYSDHLNAYKKALLSITGENSEALFIISIYKEKRRIDPLLFFIFQKVS